jgi:hypothetical protein
VPAGRSLHFTVTECIFINLTISTGHQTEACPGNGNVPAVVCAPHEPCVNCFECYRGGEEIWFTPGISGPVLAFDIETTGFNKFDVVTCVSAYDPVRSVYFVECTPNGARNDAFLRLLDEAPLLCGFNAARFDIPYLARRWDLPSGQVTSWMRKLIDPFEACKLALNRTFSLNSLLRFNGWDCKTSNGAEAVNMAAQGRWQELRDYCMADTMKTHELVTSRSLAIPPKSAK